MIVSTKYYSFIYFISVSNYIHYHQQQYAYDMNWRNQISMVVIIENVDCLDKSDHLDRVEYTEAIHRVVKEPLEQAVHE